MAQSAQAQTPSDDHRDSAGLDDAGLAADTWADALRIAEALLFAATEPVDEAQIADRLPDGVTAAAVLEDLRNHYAGRGINLVRVAKKWTFRTASDLGWLLSRESTAQKKLSRPALETLAIIAYHQPATRADVEDIRGVALSRGTLDTLLETGWIRLRGRRKAPGRPVTYGTTESFLLHFGLESISDLPGLEELKAAGLFDGRLPPGFGVPAPRDDSGLTEDEDPLEDGDLFEEQIALESDELDPASEHIVSGGAAQALVQADAQAHAQALTSAHGRGLAQAQSSARALQIPAASNDDGPQTRDDAPSDA